MKLVIAGSRHLRIEPGFIHSALINYGIRDQIKEVISGGAQGVDWAAEEFAIDFMDDEAKVLQAPLTVDLAPPVLIPASIAGTKDVVLKNPTVPAMPIACDC